MIMGDIDWIPIAGIPADLKDGRSVMVRRLYEGRLVKQGYAKFSRPAPESPMCQPLGPDPLGRPVNPVLDQVLADQARATARWLNPDQMHAFPEPTHFAFGPDDEGYWSRGCADYDGTDCANCGRERVEKYSNGRRVCEKCNWDQEAQDYAYDHHSCFS